MAIVPVCHTLGVARFACAQAGCSECLEALLQEHQALIHAVLQDRARGGLEYADLLQEGRIGLWRAILHYDCRRGYAFSSYAWAVVRHRLWQAQAGVQRWEEAAEAAEVWLELAQERIEDDWWAQQVRQALLEVVGQLPERLGQVIRQTYGLGGQGWRSLAGLGREWGISRERVRQLHEQAVMLLRLPALSLQLRSLCERDRRSDYQQALGWSRAYQRRMRRRA